MPARKQGRICLRVSLIGERETRHQMTIKTVAIAKRNPLTVSGGSPRFVSEEKRLYFAATGLPPQQAAVSTTKATALKLRAGLLEPWDVG